MGARKPEYTPTSLILSGMTLTRVRAAISLCLAVLALACSTSSTSSTNAGTTPGRAGSMPGSTTESGGIARPSTGIYSAHEALADALSGPLEYIGTGSWPGIRRMSACAYRNARVVVVDVYCSPNENHAFRVDVYSPQRGRVRIYGEADGPITTYTRAQYFSFTSESEPAPTAVAGLPALSLGMSFDELSIYDQKRYDAYLPTCYGGTQNRKHVGGCLGTLKDHAGEWSGQHRAFLEFASDDWYRLMKDLRALAKQHGRPGVD